ncbi:hypothetical protein JOM56_003084, partial [Amanita muscaria]
MSATNFTTPYTSSTSAMFDAGRQPLATLQSNTPEPKRAVNPWANLARSPVKVKDVPKPLDTQARSSRQEACGFWRSRRRGPVPKPRQRIDGKARSPSRPYSVRSRTCQAHPPQAGNDPHGVYRVELSLRLAQPCRRRRQPLNWLAASGIFLLFFVQTWLTCFFSPGFI